MRQLLPSVVDPVDVYDAYRPAEPEAPLLRLDMVASVDGSAVDEQGRTGGLGGDGDHTVFRVLRAHADGILVGANTVRVEGYGPHRMTRGLAARRAADGRPAPAPMVIVTRHLDLDPALPIFTAAATPTVLLTCTDAPADRLARARAIGPVVVAGDREVDLAAGLEALRRDHGLAQLLCEGGPTLNWHLFAADLVDELCLTLAPAIVGGSGLRIVPQVTRRHDLELGAVLEHEGELFLRYRRLRD